MGTVERYRILLLCVAVIAISSHALAQDSTLQYKRFLLPVVLKTPVPGASGSLWTTEFLLSNISGRDLSVFPYDSGGLQCNCPFTPLVPPQSTGAPFVGTDTPAIRGTFLYVDSSRLADLQMVLRVRDGSRASQTWGTNLPIVVEDRFRTEPFSIIDVPTDPDFRLTLRIYGLDGADPTPVQLRLYGKNDSGNNLLAIAADTFLGAATFALSAASSGHPKYPDRPAFLELSGLGAIGDARGHPLVRIEITPLRDGKRLWAFVSVTNNSTQHVTVLEPLNHP